MSGSFPLTADDAFRRRYPPSWYGAINHNRTQSQPSSSLAFILLVPADTFYLCDNPGFVFRCPRVALQFLPP
jgi:DNA-binding helix-hairpin-helix protein with protein kinase domain